MYYKSLQKFITSNVKYSRYLVDNLINLVNLEHKIYKKYIYIKLYSNLSNYVR